MKKLFAFIVVALVAATSFAQTDTPERRREAFEKVWSTVNEKHYDATFGGVDWNKVREKYEPRVNAAKSLPEFHNLLRLMLGELKLSHFSIYAPEAAIEDARAAGVSGIELKQVGADFVVWRVADGSPAAKAGVVRGLAMRSVGGKAVTEILAKLEPVLAERGYNESLRRVFRERTIAAALDGKAGTSVEIVAADAKDVPRTFAVARFAPNAEMSQALGNFPPQPVEFESKMLAGNVGYIRFSMWVMPQLPKIRAALREFANADGIVFDLRGNPGGVGGIATGVAGLLVKEQASLGSMTGRESTTRFIAYPQTGAFAGKVVVLTDHGSASTSEIFAVGLQDMGRAKIVGETTAGAVLPSVFVPLPTGAMFQYAISDYRSPNNVLVEGRGVTPDVAAVPTRAELLAGRDTALETALRLINGK